MMNHRAKFDAASFILGRAIRYSINTHKEKKPRTVNNIFTPCLSAYVDKNTISITVKIFRVKRFLFPSTLDNLRVFTG